MLLSVGCQPCGTSAFVSFGYPYPSAVATIDKGTARSPGAAEDAFGHHAELTRATSTTVNTAPKIPSALHTRLQ